MTGSDREVGWGEADEYWCGVHGMTEAQGKMISLRTPEGPLLL